MKEGRNLWEISKIRKKLMRKLKIITKQRSINLTKNQILSFNYRDKFHFTPMSTEKSRNKEITSRLKLENKLKEDKITKISLNLLNK